MRTSNPMLSDHSFGNLRWADLAAAERSERVMTVSGTIRASMVLITLCVAAAGGSWWAIDTGLAHPMIFTIGGGLLGLVLSLAVMFAPRSAPFTGPVLALAEGAFVGGLSIVIAGALERKAPGLGATTIAQAIGITFGIFTAMLGLYAFRILRLRGTAAKMVIAGTVGVMLVYAASMVLGLFGISIPHIHEGGPIGIAFSAIVIALASFNLVLDFQFIEDNAEAGNQPKYMEWVGAVGLLVTLVWLYVEVLRLLAKLRRE